MQEKRASNVHILKRDPTTMQNESVRVLCILFHNLYSVSVLLNPVVLKRDPTTRKKKGHTIYVERAKPKCKYGNTNFERKSTLNLM
jgi:hypothetical protein